jgi:LmeA-like phospholipid-binding
MAGRIATGLAAAIALALVLAQVLLPGVAANRISSRLGRYGTVESVSVTAWPAVKLLWGDADSVRVRAMRLRLSPAQAAKLLWEARGASSMEMTAPSMQVGPLGLTGVDVRKRGSALTAEAQMTETAVKAALPPGFRIRLLSSAGGKVEVSTGGGIFGVGVSVDAVAGASEGKLVAHPLGFLLEGLRLTLFSDPHVYVEGVGASVASASAGGPSYQLTMSATLR